MLADVAAALERCGSGTVIGHSAGGHLALWAAATGKAARVVSLAGVTDLARAAREGIGANAAVDLAGADPPAHARPALPDPIPPSDTHFLLAKPEQPPDPVCLESAAFCMASASRAERVFVQAVVVYHTAVGYAG